MNEVAKDFIAFVSRADICFKICRVQTRGIYGEIEEYDEILIWCNGQLSISIFIKHLKPKLRNRNFGLIFSNA